MHDLQQSYLLVRAGAFRCALPLSIVREIMRPLPVRSGSGLPIAVLGGAMVRGMVTPVVSLPILLGQPSGAESRFVAVLMPGRLAVLAVDEVEKIADFAAESFQPLPRLLHGIEAAEAVATADRDFILALDLALVSNLLPRVAEVTE